MGGYKPSPTPACPSSLSGSTVPFSPISPLPIIRTKFRSTRKRSACAQDWRDDNSDGASPEDPLPINDPMPWLWTCHKCSSCWPLGVTRRCLHDGHFFCGGLTTDHVSGTTRRHKACASEFDYDGWQEFRLSQDLSPSFLSSFLCRRDDSAHQEADHDCGLHCLFPSACHWNAKAETAQMAAAALMKEQEQEQAQRAAASFDFLDPSCIANPPGISPSDNMDGEGPESEEADGGIGSLRKATKKTGTYLNKLVEVAERKTSQLSTALLSRPTDSYSNSNFDDRGSSLVEDDVKRRNPLRSNPVGPGLGLGSGLGSGSMPPRIPEFTFPSFGFNVHEGDAERDRMLMDTALTCPSPLEESFALGFSESDEDDDDEEDDHEDDCSEDVDMQYLPGPDDESDYSSDSGWLQ